MFRHIRSIAIVAGCFLWALRAVSQPPSMRFETLTVEHGLSQSSVWCIMQDRQGFLWFGTADGLNRYDGYSFRVFRHDPGDSSSISNNTIWSMCEDRSGMLWVGTTAGVHRLDPGTLKFTRIADDPHYAQSTLAGMTYSILEDHTGVLWFASPSGISTLDPQTGITTQIDTPISSGQQSISSFRVLHEDDNGDVWISNGESLLRFDRGAGSVRRLVVGTNKERVLFNRSLRDHSGTYWFSTVFDGLWSLQPETAIWKQFQHDTRDSSSLPDNSIRALCEDNEGRIWVGTVREGLCYFDRTTGRFHRFQPSSGTEKNTFYEGVSALLRDRSGFVWVGYDGAGILKINPHRNKFHHTLLPRSNAPASGDNFFKALMVDHLGLVWLGMYDQGISVLDRSADRVTRYRHNPSDPTSLKSNTVFALLEDSRKSIWAGTYEGIDEFDPETGRFKHLNLPALTGSPRGSIVTTIAEDPHGRIWCGTTTLLARFDPRSGTFERILSTPELVTHSVTPAVTSLCFQGDSALWVGTLGAGLLKMHLDGRIERQFTYTRGNPNSISHNNVKTILVDPDGILWIGTEEGLNRYDPVRERWRVHRIADGLPNEFIYGVLMDEQRRLWISTNKGLSRMDTRNPDRPVFRNYTPDDGLQSYEFNTNVYFRTSEGEMFFGGINGFNSFFPDSVEDNPHVPTVVLTGFKKFDLPVQLEEDISRTDEVRLDYDESVFSIEFAGLEFTNPSKNRYAYKMDGVDKDWVYTRQRREARYTHLNPGEYTFHVKGSNNDGVWNEMPTSLRVIIVPPFWKTSWFIGLMVLLGVGTFGGTVRFISTQKLKKKIQELERQKALHEERLRTRERIARDLHDDLASTVGSAGFFVESVKHQLKDIPSETKEFLDKTSSLLTEAEEAMSDIVWSVSPKHDTVESLFSRMRLTTADLCRPRAIQYETEFARHVEGLTLTEEVRRNIFLIFKEALANAVRHSGASSIRVAFMVGGGSFEMSIMDNGQGMPSGDLSSASTKRGHGIRNMMKRAEEIGAEFSIEAGSPFGTIIHLRGRMTQVSH